MIIYYYDFIQIVPSIIIYTMEQFTWIADLCVSTHATAILLNVNRYSQIRGIFVNCPLVRISVNDVIQYPFKIEYVRRIQGTHDALYEV